MQQLDNFVFTSDKYKPYFSFWKQIMESGVDRFSVQQIHRSENTTGQQSPVNYSFSIDPALCGEILKMVNQQDTGVMLILMVSAGIVLSKYVEQDVVIFETPTFGLKNMEKRYVERVPVVLAIDSRQRFRDVLTMFQKQIGEFYRYQNFPLSLIDYTRGIFDTNVYFEFEGVHDRVVGSETDGMMIKVRRAGDALNVDLILNPQVFDDTFARNFANHFQDVLRALNQPEIRIGDILLGPDDAQLASIRNFNTNPHFTAQQTTLVDSFEAQVARTPERTAVVWKGNTLTYNELNAKANGLAAYIRLEYGVADGHPVGVMLDRGSDLIVAILGILKAGGAYVPIDPEYPAERKAYFFADTAMTLLLTSSDYLFSIADYTGAVMAVDIQTPDVDASTVNIAVRIDPEQTAYIIYTSGSTGRPKGVMVPHRGAVNMIGAQIAEFNMTAADTTLQFSSVSFDASVSEIFKTLLVGAKLIMMEKQLTSNPDQFIRLMKDEGVTVVTIPPSYLNILPLEQLNFLRMIISAGEAANLRHAIAFSSFGTYYNAYGPTECSVCVSVERFDPARAESKLSIGRPIAHTAVHLLTRAGHPSPLGLPGEICVSGAGIAHGYLNAPELTAEKFVRNPADPTALLYKTGDMGRWLPDGRLEFIGRKDTQVKVRGFRIELSEVEACALNVAPVNHCVCVLHTEASGEKQVVLYYTADNDLRSAELRKYLEAALPQYMVPAHLVKVNAFHFLPSGKINRRVLPDVSTVTQEADYIAPESELEKTLASIWSNHLSMPRIGIHDNFFAIGGDSIKAIRLAVEMNKTLGVSIEVNDIFSHSTIASLLENIVLPELEAARPDNTDADAVEQELVRFRTTVHQRASGLDDAEDIIPMSDIQKGMVFHTLMRGDDGLYKEQMYFEIRDNTYDDKIFRKAVNLMAQKHAILRTSFLIDEGGAAQVIHRYAYSEDNLFYEDLSPQTQADQKKYLQDVLLFDKYKDLNLRDKVLWKISVFRLTADEYAIMFSCSHALVDGWSNASLMTELSHAYFSLKQTGAYSVTPLRASYRDYVADQIRVNRSESIRAFWGKTLEDYVKSPLPYNKPAGEPRGVSNYTFSIPPQVTDAMANLSQRGAVSMKHLFLSAFSFFLRLVTGETDLTFGLVTNSRPAIEDGDKIIGCFTNTVPFRVRTAGPVAASGFVAMIDSQAKALKAFDKLSLIEIMKVIHEETTNDNPIFDIIFNYVDFHIYETVHTSSEVSDGIIDEQPRGNTNTLFDFTVCKADRRRNNFIVNLNYRTGLYERSEIDQLFRYYVRILERLVHHSEEELSPLTVLAENELLTRWHPVMTRASTPDTVVTRFEEQVTLTPERVALTGRNEEYTYAELNRKANALAAYLRSKHNIGPNALVGIMARRSPATVVGILGILKAGGAYVPISVDDPAERKKQLLANSEIGILLTESDLMFSLLDFYNGEIFALDIQLDTLEIPDTDLPHVNSDADLAYVMFTSGSTGVPKGVMIEHRSVVNLVTAPNFITLSGQEKLLQTGAVSFDATTFEYWSMLLHGGQLYVRDEELLNIRKLKAIIADNEISTMWFTAAWFNQLVDSDVTLFGPLKTVLVGGDRLSPEHIARFRQTHPAITLVNGYGPTETTTFALCHRIRDEQHERVPIGTPVQHTTVYLLDHDDMPVPQGVSGEICIGGAGLARGYWKQPGLTQQKFVTVKIRGIDTLVYRTGDYARWLADGTVDFLGRKDNQVKVRGYRIELAEIERALMQYGGIQEARVIVRNGAAGDRQVLAYAVSTKTLVQADVVSFLRQMLPDYMCPDYVISLAAFPLTPNGKVDIKRLPDPDSGAADAGGYVAPVSDFEKLMVSVLEDVLGRRRIGLNDNFFMVGGDSIKAIQVSSRLHKEGYAVEVKDIFTYPLVGQLALEVKKVVREIDQSMVAGEMSLTPIQQDFFSRKRVNAHHFNQAVLLQPAERLDPERLNEVFNKLIRHHDILRSVFVIRNGTYRQVIQPIGETLAVDVYDLRNAEDESSALEERCNNAQSSLNIEQGPLLKVVLAQLREADRLLIVIHHLIVDGVSWRILLDDLQALLLQAQRGETLLLPLKTDSFIAWSGALQQHAASAGLHDEQVFWLDSLGKATTPLPVRPVGSNAIRDARMETVLLDEETTALFLSRAHEAFNTRANDILLSALGIAINRAFGLTEMLIALEGHGREDVVGSVDVTRTVGWFTSIFPVALTNLGERNFDRIIKLTKENLNAIPARGIGFGILKYLTGDAREVLRVVKPSVSFNYLGQFDAEVSNAAFRLASESSGNTVDDREDRIYDLDIAGLVIDGKLRFNVSYNPDHFEPGVVEMFCSALGSFTKDMIHYCADFGERELTPSDLTHKGISMDMLDSIRQMIE